MCGIVACMVLNPTATVPSLNVGVAALAHRGPDGQNAWISPGGRVTLAHTRLSSSTWSPAANLFRTRIGPCGPW
jgi:asparagine synthase (glutamine-hydrolysing)